MKCFRFNNLDGELIARSFYEAEGLPYVVSDIDYRDIAEINAVKNYAIEESLFSSDFVPDFEIVSCREMETSRVVSFVLPNDLDTFRFMCFSMGSRETLLLLKTTELLANQVNVVIDSVIEERKYFVGYQLKQSEICNIVEGSTLAVVLDDMEGVICLSGTDDDKSLSKLSKIITSTIVYDETAPELPKLCWLSSIEDIKKFFSERWSK